MKSFLPKLLSIFIILGLLMSAGHTASYTLSDAVRDVEWRKATAARLKELGIVQRNCSEIPVHKWINVLVAIKANTLKAKATCGKARRSK